MSDSTQRGQWTSRAGFVLAAAGSAVGLGNLWKFPYITGQNGGGAFVLVYLAFIALIGLPIMIAEVAVGRSTQQSPVGAFRALSRPGSAWIGVGWLGVLTGFLILSFYSVVAGWGLHFLYLACVGTFGGTVSNDELSGLFVGLYGDPWLNVVWHAVFMVLTVGIVIGGVQKGVERGARVLMPALFALMVALLAFGTRLEGFGEAFDFVFGFHTDKLTGAGVLEALGHAFFSLSVGMGAMLTFGSYMKGDDDVVRASIWICALDTLVALMACLVVFPITFSEGLEPGAGPGLVFKNIPLAFAHLPGGSIWAIVFFLLLVFAALSSSVSLLEVVAAYFIDEKGWSRPRAVGLLGAIIFLVGIPSALTGGTEVFGSAMEGAIGTNWFDTIDHLTGRWMLPLGGLGVAVFLAFRVDETTRHLAVTNGSRLGAVRGFYLAWLNLLRYLVPIGIGLTMLHALGVFGG